MPQVSGNVSGAANKVLDTYKIRRDIKTKPEALQELLLEFDRLAHDKEQTMADRNKAKIPYMERGAEAMLGALDDDRLLPDGIDKQVAAKEAVRRYSDPMSKPIRIGTPAGDDGTGLPPAYQNHELDVGV